MQTHTDTDFATAVATQPQIRLWPQQPLHSGLTPGTVTQGHTPFSSWAVETESHKCSTHPTFSRFTNTCTALPSTSTSPLPAQHPCPDPSHPYQPHRSPAGLTGGSLPICSTHTLVSLAGHTHGTPQIPALPHCLPDTTHPPSPTSLDLGPPTPGCSSLEFASESPPTRHAQMAWARYTDSPHQKHASQDEMRGPDPALSPSLIVH